MPLDEKDLEQIGKLWDERDKKRSEEFAKTLEGSVSKMLKAHAEASAKQLETFKTETDKKLEGIKADPPKDPPKDPPGDDSPALRKLQAEQEKLQKALEAQTKRAEEAETKRRADLLQNSVRDALIAQGADPKRLAIAMSHLTSSGVVKLNDKGEPVFTFAEKWGPEDVAAAEGAKKWLATDEGKFFLPPTGKQGTGDGVQRNGPQQGGSAPRTQSGEVDWSKLASRVNLAPLEGASDS